MDELRSLIRRKALAIQKKLKYSDQKMADTIGVSRIMWQKVRTGNVGIGGQTLSGLLNAFPALSQLKDGVDRDIEITLKIKSEAE